MLAGADILGLAALALSAAVDAGAGASPGARTPVPFSLTPPSPPGRGRGAGGAQLWAELDATSEAGAEGRAGLLAFVATELPAGSPQAFSAAEIAACPAAADGARFRPSGGRQHHR